MTLTVTEVDHPIVNDALARMRSVETSNANFRAHLNRLGIILLAEATKTCRHVRRRSLPH